MCKTPSIDIAIPGFRARIPITPLTVTGLVVLGIIAIDRMGPPPPPTLPPWRG